MPVKVCSATQSSLCHCFTVHPFIVERSESRHHGDAKGLLAGDFVSAENTPGTLSIANAGLFREAIDSNGKLNAVDENVFGEGSGDFDRSVSAKETAFAIADVGPTFQKNAANAVFFNRVKASFEANEVVPRLILRNGNGSNGFGTLASAAHHFFAAGRRMCHATIHFYRNNFRTASEEVTDFVKGFADGVEFRFSGAAYGDEESRHRSVAKRNCTGAESEKKQLESERAEENFRSVRIDGFGNIPGDGDE